MFFYIEEQTQQRYQVSMLEFYVQAKKQDNGDQTWTNHNRVNPNSLCNNVTEKILSLKGQWRRHIPYTSQIR